MTNKENIEQSYKDYLYELDNATIKYDKEKLCTKFAWLSSRFFDINTDDYDLDIEFGKDIYHVMKAIHERRTFEYINDKESYKKFIVVCNLLKLNHLIECGTSIRSSWFDYYGDKEREHGEIYGDVNYIKHWNQEIMSYLLYEFMKGNVNYED